MPSDAEIAGMYSEEYFTSCTDAAGAHGTRPYMEIVEASADELRHDARRFERRLRRYVGSAGRFCEIGCGPGYLLAELRTLGWSVEGIEISEYAANHARTQLGLDVRTGPLSAGSLPNESYDVVFLGDVLEHLPRPVEALGLVRAALRPNGIVVIAVPSTLNLLSGRLGLAIYQVLGRFKNPRIPPYHLFEYTPATLRRVIEAAGFRLESIRQSAVPLRRMGLRGNPVENLGKVSLQILAHVTSFVVNRGGDRLLAVARRTTL
jgi:SAM-dependent methyltransferase